MQNRKWARTFSEMGSRAAQINGFRTISAYVRDKLLRVPYRMEQMVVDIYQKLIQIKP